MALTLNLNTWHWGQLLISIISWHEIESHTYGAIANAFDALLANIMVILAIWWAIWPWHWPPQWDSDIISFQNIHNQMLCLQTQWNHHLFYGNNTSSCWDMLRTGLAGAILNLSKMAAMLKFKLASIKNLEQHGPKVNWAKFGRFSQMW